MNQISESTHELFSEYEDIPSENNPFCNSTESIHYNESYSNILPTFFFRISPCSERPSSFEKKMLKYFYNTASVSLAVKLMTEISLYLILCSTIMMISFILKSSDNLYYAMLSDATVRYSFLIITGVISTLIAYFTGRRYTSIKIKNLIGQKHIKTTDMILFLMTGLFISSLNNIISYGISLMSKDYPVSELYLTKDINRILVAFIYTCIVSPVSEALIFRGIILKNFSRAGQCTGILFSSFLCAISTGRPEKMIPCFLISILFSLLTIRCNTIIPSLIIHFLINTSNLAIALYSLFLEKEDNFITQSWTAITFASGFVFAVIFLIKIRIPKNSKPQKKRGFPLIIKSIFFLLTTMLYIFANISGVLKFMYI